MLLQIVEKICHFQGYAKDLEACPWLGPAQFQSYISVMLHINDVCELLITGMSVNENHSATKKMLEKYKMK